MRGEVGGGSEREGVRDEDVMVRGEGVIMR